MSKSAREFLQEFEPQNQIADDFRLHVLKVKVDDSGEVEPSGNVQPVIKIEIDHENKECLLHFVESGSDCITVSDVKAVFVDKVLDYEVCAAQEKILEDSHVRLDTPFIGFGENFEMKCFFAVCQA